MRPITDSTRHAVRRRSRDRRGVVWLLAALWLIAAVVLVVMR